MMWTSSRRQFLKCSTGLLLGLTLPMRLLASAPERQLAFYNLHTGESLRLSYWVDGDYVADALPSLNHLMRDHRTNEVYPMQPKLLDQLYVLQQLVATPGPFHVISAYRSPKINQRLQVKSSGVAKKSLHMQGMAIDICLPGKSLGQLHQAALSLQAGGVGYYPRSNFIHLDVGRVRHWA